MTCREDFEKWLANEESEQNNMTAWEGWQACAELKDKEIDMLRAAIRKTLDENGHLADGDNCTLIDLKRAIGE